MLVNSFEVMEEPMSFDLDYQHMNGFGGLLSPIGTDMSSSESPIKTEEELTLLNISGNKPSLSTGFSQSGVQSSPQNLDNLLKIIESNEKQNEQMMIQYRLKQVLLDYLKTKQSPHSTTCAAVSTGSQSGTGSPSLCQQQNHCTQALETDCQRVPAILNVVKNPMISGYPNGNQSPHTLTPPISPDIGQQFFISASDPQKTSIPFIGLNTNTEAIDCQQFSETVENFYSSEPEEQQNNQISIEESAEELDEESEDNNRIESCFDETFDYRSVSSANSPLYCCEGSPKYTNSNSPIHQSSTKRSTVKASIGRKISTQSAPDQSMAAQKRSAHLSAEFRYRTKLNDKITKLRNIVGPKSQLSKSGVLSRSIDLISKLQKSNIKLKEENKRIRILLMQACNQLPNNSMPTSVQPLSHTMYIQ